MHHHTACGGHASVAAQLSWDTITIASTLNELAEAMDQHDGERLKALFTEDATADFSAVARKLDMDAPTMDSRDAIARCFSRQSGGMETMRVINNVRVRLQGKIARLTALVHERHFRNENGEKKTGTKMLNTYEADLIQQKGHWRIRRLTAENHCCRAAQSH